MVSESNFINLLHQIDQQISDSDGKYCVLDLHSKIKKYDYFRDTLKNGKYIEGNSVKELNSNLDDNFNKKK